MSVPITREVFGNYFCPQTTSTFLIKLLAFYVGQRDSEVFADAGWKAALQLITLFSKDFHFIFN